MNNSETIVTADQVPAQSADSAQTMSTPATVVGIFTEPTAVFNSLRERPRFLVALVLCIAAFMLFNVTYFERMGFETVIRAQTEANPRAADVPAEQKEQAIAVQLKPVVKAIRLLAPVVIFTLVAVVGGLLYLICATMFGGKLNYKRALSVWTYSTLPPAVFIMLCNFVLLFVAEPDTNLAIARGARRGLVQSSLGVLIDGSASPVLATLLGGFDAFTFYGLFLGAIGLRRVAKMSAGAAWATSLTIWGAGLMLKVGYVALTGTQM
ncbi:MAG: YIP1 family protein [Pyrinomonadaceae bacterium]